MVFQEYAMRPPLGPTVRAPLAANKRQNAREGWLPGPLLPRPSGLPSTDSATMFLPGHSTQSPPGQQKPTASPPHLFELALTAAAMSFHSAAIEALRECTALAPNHGPAWRKIA